MAVTISAMDVSQALKIAVEQAERLTPVATSLVTEYSRGSTIPPEVQNEAVFRCVGWLASSAHMAGVSSQKVDDLEVTYATSQRAPLRNSGAMSLLSPYKKRRAC